MSYIGNEPTSVAFLTDTFSGNGSTTAFTMSVAPATTSSVLVAITGVLQDPSTYSVSGTTLTFSAAPPSGTSNISVRYLGIPASGVTTTAYRTVTEFTATAGQTSFSVPSYTVGYVDVYRNGVMLGSADYTATTGTTIVLASGATAGDLIRVESFYVSSVLNAMPTTGGTFSGNVLFASGSGIWNTAGNVGVGVTPSDWTSANAVQVQYATVEGRSAYPSFSEYAANTYSQAGVRKYIASDYASKYTQYQGTHSWHVAPSGTAGNTITFTQAMTLDASGRLGVGVTNPAHTVDASSGGSKFNYLQITNNGYAGTGATTPELYSPASATLAFASGGAERMRIDSNGNVGIGSTNPSTKFQVNFGDSAGNLINLVGDGSTSGAAIASNWNTGSSYLDLRVGGTTSSYTKLRVTNGGILYCSGVYSTTVGGTNRDVYVDNSGVVGYVSSIRESKINIQNIQNTKWVYELNPVTFNYRKKDDAGVYTEEIDGDIQYGLIAEDVETVNKDLCFYDDVNGEQVLKGINYSKLITPMLKAIQEQQASISELKAEVDSLKAEVAALKGTE